MRFIELFAGIGGFRLAIEKLEGSCVFASEIEAKTQEVYKSNFGEKPEGDITQIHNSDIPMHDLLVGGFPCQPFSMAGKKKGINDTRGTLFFEIARIAEYHQPKVLFLENVFNLALHDEGRTINTILEVLHSIGYKTYQSVLNASFYSTPSSRLRIYIVAFKQDLKINTFSFPKPTFEPVKLIDCMDKIVDDKFYINNVKIRIDPMIEENSKNLFGEYPLAPIRIGDIGSKAQGYRIYSSLGHAITFCSSAGGIAAKTGAYYVNGKIRKLTPRECARVMGFPDNYKLHKTESVAYIHIGNTVAVKVIQEIYKQILSTISSHPSNF